MKHLLVLILLFIPFIKAFSLNNTFNDEGKINVIVIGAHPDDADGSTGGTAIKFAELGHNVLFVSLTNGDAGHQSIGGGELARIRRAEAEEAGKRFGVKYIVLENHDGELMPTLELRKDVIRLIREWNADIVIGPNADNIYNQLGDYTAPQERSNIVTVLDGIKNAVNEKTSVYYTKGCDIRDTTETNIQEAVDIANKSDVVILVVGGSSARDFKTEYIETGAATITGAVNEKISDMESGEGFDRSSLDLLGDQEKLISEIANTGKPLIVIYIQGRHLNMNNASEKAAALLSAWYPGQEGGNAVADILFGDYNPSGRLPVSVPRSVGQLPVYYSLGRQADYVEESSSPLYPFGYGLSYTNFEYSDLEVNNENNIIKVRCTISNIGNFDGEEVVQLYIRDNISTVYTPPIQLKDFKKINVKKGEYETVEFILSFDDLALYDSNMMRVVEPGEFSIVIGSSSNSIHLKGNFTID
jgi:beta-glucosidase